MGETWEDLCCSRGVPASAEADRKGLWLLSVAVEAEHICDKVALLSLTEGPWEAVQMLTGRPRCNS